MDFSIDTRRGAGYPITSGNTRSGISLESSRSSSGFPLRREVGIPLDRNQAGAFPVGAKGFPVGSAAMERNSEAERTKLREAAEGFEAIFIRQLLQTMRSTSTEGSMYGGGSTGEMYADMVESALADSMAKEGSFGIADTLCRRMLTQENGGTGARIASSENTPKAGEGK